MQGLPAAMDPMSVIKPILDGLSLIVMAIGAAVFGISGAIAGVRHMTSGGNPERRAESMSHAQGVLMGGGMMIFFAGVGLAVLRGIIHL